MEINSRRRIIREGGKWGGRQMGERRKWERRVNGRGRKFAEGGK